MTLGMEHECDWGPLERSWFAGTVHRKCKVEGCRIISALDDDPEEDEDEMIKVNISWVYTPHHRYNSDLNEKVQDVVTRMAAETGSQEEGESGGSGFSPDYDDFAADSVHHLLVPDREAAEKIRAGVDQILKSYDPRYEATLTLAEA